MKTETLDTQWEIVPANLGLESGAKESLETAFVGFFRDAETLINQAESITDPKEARSARLELKNVRVAAEKKRKELKEDSLRVGKAIDGANNILLAKIVPVERAMEEIEKEEERREEARIEALREEREGIIFDLGQTFHGLHLGKMTEENWTEYLQQAKDLQSVRLEREKREREEAEARAKKEAEEREAQRLENIKLKAEAEAREKAMQAEREKMEKERAEIQKKAKAEAEAREKLEQEAAKAKAEAARIQHEAEEKQRKEAELEQARIKAEKEALAKKAAAPDKEKIIEFSRHVESMPTPKATTEKGKAICAEIEAKTKSFARWILTQAAEI